MAFSVTLLVPPIGPWLAGPAANSRYPHLEKFFSRATTHSFMAGNIDSLRMNLFDRDDSAGIPAAALSQLASGGEIRPDGWYLRLEPVSLHADLSRIMMVNCGLDEFPFDYRSAIGETIATVLSDHGLELQAGSESFWVLELDRAPDVTFAALDDVLGADISEFLPAGKDAVFWKQLMTEIQISLHASPVNQARRAEGARTINSVWFWGGGALPTCREARAGTANGDGRIPPLSHVIAEDAVSVGLARMDRCSVVSLKDWLEGMQAGLIGGSDNDRVLIDWVTTDPRLQVSIDQLEQKLGPLLQRLKTSTGKLEIVSPGCRWTMNSAALRHFWKRRKPLSSLLQQPNDRKPLS